MSLRAHLTLCKCITVVMASALASQAGAVIIAPTIAAGGAGVSFSNEFSNREVVNIVNGSGITGPVTASSVHTGGPGVSPNGIMWHTGSGTTGFVTFDLGTTYGQVREALVWQFAEGTGTPNNFDRGTASMNIFVSSDSDVTTATFNQITGPGTGGSFNLPIHPTSQVGVNAVVLPLSSAQDVRLVQFDILSNHGDPGFVGLSEVRFEGRITPIPEPSSGLMLATGAIAATAVIRRRRSRNPGINEAA